MGSLPSITFLINHRLFNLDTDLALVLARPLVLVSLTELLQAEDLGVNNRAELLDVGLDSAAHVLHLGSASDKETTGSAKVGKAVEETRVVLASTTDEADDGDDTINLDGVERLLHGRGTGDLDDVVNTSTAGDLLGLGSPLGSLLVVDDVVGTELLEELGLLAGAGGSDDLCAGSLGELDGEDGDTAGSLGENPLAGEELLALKTVETVPGGQTGAGKGSGLVELKTLGHGDKTLLVESTDGSEGTVDDTTETGLDGEVVERTADVALVEKGDDLVAGLEAGDVLADGENGTGTIGAGDDTILGGEGVSAEREDEITVVEGSTLELDENLAVTELRSGSLAELHTTEVLGIPRRNDPLLNGLRNRLRHVEDVLLVFCSV
jgi:hypothetical protein